MPLVERVVDAETVVVGGTVRSTYVSYVDPADVRDDDRVVPLADAVRVSAPMREELLAQYAEEYAVEALEPLATDAPADLQGERDALLAGLAEERSAAVAVRYAAKMGLLLPPKGGPVALEREG
jgi:hypothetical protein